MSQFSELHAGELAEGRFTFSVAALVRLTTLAAATIGVFLLVPAVSPRVMSSAVILVGAVLAAFVGWRRAGMAGARCTAALAFWGSSLAVAWYIGYAGHVIQQPISEAFPFFWFFRGS